MDKKNKMSLHTSPASLRAIARQSRQTLLRHSEFISGFINPTMWTLRQAQSDGTKRLFNLDSRILKKSENDGNGTGNAKIATGLSAPRNDNKKGNVIANLSPSVIANEVKQSHQTTGNAKIATGLTSLAMTGKDKDFTQNGRSMIEMIGVLALVGALSIGIIAGFRQAITRHHVNNLIEDVKLAGFIVVAGKFSTLPEEETEMTSDFIAQTNYTFSAFKETEYTFGIVVEKVSQAHCLEVKQRQVPWLEEVQTDSPSNSCEEENKMLFYFNTDLISEQECQIDRHCKDVEGKPYCVNNTCQPCEKGMVITNNECEKCPTGQQGYFYSTQESCNQCSNTVFSAAYGCCYSCFRVSIGETTKSECVRCLNRYWIGTYVDENSLGRCFYCEGVVTNNGTDCLWICPDKDGEPQFGSGDNGCLLCSDSRELMYGSNRETCSNCDNRFYGIYTDSGYLDEMCTACSYPDTDAFHIAIQRVYYEDCIKCGNRYSERYEGQNACRVCPANTYNASDGIGVESCVACPTDKSTLPQKKYCRACGGSWNGKVCE